MASQKRACVFILAIVFMLCFLNQSHAVASAIDHNTTTCGNNTISLTARDIEDDIVVSLYYESLCPYCADFIVNQLVKVFETDLVHIVKLRLIPWGNTQITPNNTWICQHGPDECTLNMVEACAIHVWPNPALHYKFIYCIESLRLKNEHNKWQSCFNTLGINSTPIRNCLNTGLAVKLEQGYADETAHLNPPHRFVPWVLVNNLPLQEDYQNFVAYICKAYRGTVTPQACKSHALGVNSDKMVNATQ
ncbi:hypothetical protein ACH5RR_005181 [Cinchona calisaya]|uniref:Gamma-interferon-inducible lysosomal thiol reductase n=1 Tax=Cinchona calisaya TaxID=153742 RepID=A0ABD3AKF0_9GENT